MTLKVSKPNPYGSLTEVMLNDFEKSCCRLPKSFRDYQLRYNGGLPRRAEFWVGCEFQYSSKIRKIFPIGVGPEMQRLENWWHISREFDLEEHAEELSPFVVVAEAAGGAYLGLNKDSGQVIYFEFDCPALPVGQFLSQQSCAVGESWERFLEGM